jgi:hypothetical protein
VVRTYALFDTCPVFQRDSGWIGERERGREGERERGREGERERGRKRREGEKERILVILGAEIDGYRPRLESKRKGFLE